MNGSLLDVCTFTHATAIGIHFWDCKFHVRNALNILIFSMSNISGQSSMVITKRISKLLRTNSVR